MLEERPSASKRRALGKIIYVLPYFLVSISSAVDLHYVFSMSLINIMSASELLEF